MNKILLTAKQNEDWFKEGCPEPPTKMSDAERIALLESALKWSTVILSGAKCVLTGSLKRQCLNQIQENENLYL